LFCAPACAVSTFRKARTLGDSAPCAHRKPGGARERSLGGRGCRLNNCASSPMACETWASVRHGRSHVFRMAIFRQINKDVPRVYHDTVEFLDGTFVLLIDPAGTRSLGMR
jgi:hypothetical protein